MKILAFKSLVENLGYGKRLREATYVIRPDTVDVSNPLHAEILRAEAAAKPPPDWNLLKLHTREHAITFLVYPDFEADPHPALAHSTKINLNTGRVVRTDYTQRANPPILHRKETFLPHNDPRREVFAELTRAEEAAGLYRDKSRIGLRLYWESLLKKMRLSYDGYLLVNASGDKAEGSEDPVQSELVERHRTAIKRYDLSKPVKLLLKHGLLNPGRTFFDFGCGHGMDVDGLQSLGYDAEGWDPAFRKEAERRRSEVVNLGYVLNVIEKPTEREEALRRAFALAGDVLLVSVLGAGQETEAHSRPFGDGFLTKNGTFQKFYAPAELEILIERVLEREPVTLALGICLVFRHGESRERFLSSRTRRHVDWTEIGNQLRFTQSVSREEQIVGRYELHRELFDSLWNTMLELGRAPDVAEVERLDEIRAAGGGLKRAVDLLRDYHGPELLREARRVREDDVLVYLAMKHFDRRFLRKHLPDRMKRDIKAFFGDFEQAKRKGVELLFASGDPDELRLALNTVDVGWRDVEEEHFSFHRSLLDRMPAVIRCYVLCGLRRFGDLDETDVIKIHLNSGKLTLQSYDDFDAKPLPQLQLRIKIDLRKDFVTVFDHRAGPHRQVLYFKERFVTEDYLFKNDAAGFSARLQRLGFDPTTVGYGPSFAEFEAFRESRGLTQSLLPSRADRS